MNEPNVCTDNVRYSLSDSGGQLRFTRFEVLGPLRGTKMAKSLKSYFKGRNLKEVSLEQISKNCPIKDRECLESIIKEIVQLKKQFYRPVPEADRREAGK